MIVFLFLVLVNFNTYASGEDITKTLSETINSICKKTIQEYDQSPKFKDIKDFNDPQLLSVCQVVASQTFNDCLNEQNKKFDPIVKLASTQPEAKRLPKLMGAFIELCCVKSDILSYEAISMLSKEAIDKKKTISEVLKSRAKKNK